MLEVTSEARQRLQLFSQIDLRERMKPVYTGRLPRRIGLGLLIWGRAKEMTRKNHIFSKARQKCVIIEGFADHSARQKAKQALFLIIKNLQPISVGV